MQRRSRSIHHGDVRIACVRHAEHAPFWAPHAERVDLLFSTEPAEGLHGAVPRDGTFASHAGRTIGSISFDDPTNTDPVRRLAGSELRDAPSGGQLALYHLWMEVMGGSRFAASEAHNADHRAAINVVAVTMDPPRWLDVRVTCIRHAAPPRDIEHVEDLLLSTEQPAEAEGLYGAIPREDIRIPRGTRRSA